MTELERRLVETLRTQAGEIKPNPQAWAEHIRRVHTPKRSRRPMLTAVAAVLAVLALVITLLPRAQESQVSNAIPVQVHVLRGPFQVASMTVDDSVWIAYFARVQYPGAADGVYDCFYAVPRGSDSQNLPHQPMLPGYPKCDADASQELPLSEKVLSRRVYVVSSKVANLAAFGDDQETVPVSEVGRSNDLAVFVAYAGDQPVRFVGVDAHGIVVTTGTNYPTPRGAR